MLFRLYRSGPVVNPVVCLYNPLLYPTFRSTILDWVRLLTTVLSLARALSPVNVSAANPVSRNRRLAPACWPWSSAPRVRRGGGRGGGGGSIIMPLAQPCCSSGVDWAEAMARKHEKHESSASQQILSTLAMGQAGGRSCRFPTGSSLCSSIGTDTAQCPSTPTPGHHLLLAVISKISIESRRRRNRWCRSPTSNTPPVPATSATTDFPWREAIPGGRLNSDPTWFWKLPPPMAKARRPQQ